MLLHYLTNTLSLLCLQTKVIPFILSTIAHLINFIDGTSLSYLLFGYAHLTFPFSIIKLHHLQTSNNQQTDGQIQSTSTALEPLGSH